MSHVIGALLEVVAEILLTFPPKSKRGIAILCAVLGLALAAIVYFGGFMAEPNAGHRHQPF